MPAGAPSKVHVAASTSGSPASFAHATSKCLHKLQLWAAGSSGLATSMPPALANFVLTWSKRMSDGPEFSSVDPTADTRLRNRSGSSRSSLTNRPRSFGPVAATDGGLGVALAVFFRPPSALASSAVLCDA